MTATHEERTRSSPYRGLEPFDEADAAFFFGRERETRLITASLFAAPLTVLYGASGVGKSSVLRAGVLPRLRERHDLLPVVFPTVASEAGTASSVVLRGWQSDPLSGIKETTALALHAASGDKPSVRRRFQDAVLKHKTRSLREFLVACHKVSRRRVMVILDQFEEYSLYHPEDEAFAEQFPDAVVPGDLSVSFLVSLREDAVAKLDRFKGRISGLWDSYRRIDHLDRQSAEEAIRRPLDEYNRQQPECQPMRIEDTLINKVLDDVQTESVQFEGTGSGTLGRRKDSAGRIETPYLQLVMTRLWEREQAEGSRELRFVTLEREGFAPQIVLTHLDRVMEQFTDDERDVAARVFHRLVTPSGAKIAFTVGDLAEYERIESEKLAPILRRLEEGSRRILRRVAARTETADEPRYEIFHDRLGTAVLAWRTKRLKEQERERSQREEAEKKKIAEQTRAEFRKAVEAAMNRLEPELQAMWARMISYLVATSGPKLTQTASSLASLSQLPLDSVQNLLERLRHEGILRLAYGLPASSNLPLYEIAHDEIGAALLEWHSRYVQHQTRTAKAEFALEPVPPASPTAALQLSATRQFPYSLVSDLLRRGALVPFIGAGASMSGRLKDSAGSQAFPLTNRELKEELGRACEFPASEFEASDIAEVASYFVQQAGRAMLDEFLDKRLGSMNAPISSTHRFLAQAAGLTPLLILTTNYDTLMERALREANQPFGVLTYVPGDSAQVEYTPVGGSWPQLVDPRQIPPETGTVTMVIRLHGPSTNYGTKDVRQTGYVLTEEDQIDWLFHWPKWLPPTLMSGVGTGSLLSLGHSARDWSQRALLRSLYSNRSKYSYKGDHESSWAVAMNPAPLSVMTWQRYGVEVYNIELNEWASSMMQEISGFRPA